MDSLRRTASVTSLEIKQALEKKYPRAHPNAKHQDHKHGMPRDRATLEEYLGYENENPTFLETLDRAVNSELRSRANDVAAKTSITNACKKLKDSSRDNRYATSGTSIYRTTIQLLIRKLNELNENADITDKLYNKITLIIGVTHQAREDGVLSEDTCQSLERALERFAGNESLGLAGPA
jgi:phosphate starvation-inducible protein PhoH